MDYRMSDWCTQACAYIKYRPDRKAAEKELLDHINDKYSALVSSGMMMREAAEAAVRAMGDAGEVGRALAKAHRPLAGYFLTMTKVLLAVAAVCLFFTIFRARDRMGIYRQDKESARTIDSLFLDEHKDISGEGYASRMTRTLYLEPDCSAKSDGYTFTVTRVAQWCNEYESEESSGVDYILYLTIKATHPLPWAGYPEAVRWFTATDSLGNYYSNMWDRLYSYEKELAGNPYSRGLFSYTYEMWLGYYVPGADWVELRYERDGRDLALRIELVEAK